MAAFTCVKELIREEIFGAGQQLAQSATEQGAALGSQGLSPEQLFRSNMQTVVYRTVTSEAICTFLLR